MESKQIGVMLAITFLIFANSSIQNWEQSMNQSIEQTTKQLDTMWFNMQYYLQRINETK